MSSNRINYLEKDDGLSILLGGVLDTAIAITEADFGNIQIIDPEGNLKVLAHRNLPDWWIRHWDTVKSEEGSCGTALATGKRIVVEDVEQSPIFAGTPGLDTLLNVGIRAIQSTPLIAKSGQVMGVFSTHYSKRHRPNAQTLKTLDLLANHAAALIEREYADQEINKLESEFHAAIESSADGFWVVNDQSRILAVNDVYVRRSGYSREELLQMHVADVDMLFDNDTVQHQIENIHQQGNALFETQHRTKSGEVWPVEVNAVYQPKAGGKIYSFLRDITKRKKAEEALRKSESRLSRAQNAAKIGTWEWDVQTNLNYWSDETFRLYGLDPGSVSPSYENWLASVCLEDKAEAAAAASEAVAKKSELAFQWRSCRDGRWLLSRGQPQFDADGQLVRYLGVVIDITEQKQAHEALEKTRNLLAESQKIAHLGSFEYDLATGSTLWSEEQYRIYGLDPAGAPPNLAEIVARSIPKEDSDLVYETFITAVEKHESYELEHRLVRTDGSVRWVRSRAQPFFDEHGEVLRYVGTTLDITELRQAEELARERMDDAARLQRLDTASELTTLMAHEINQPLAAVAAYAGVCQQILKNPDPDLKKLRDVIGRVSQQAMRAGEIIHHIRKFVARNTSTPEPMYLNAAIRITQELMEVSARMKKVRLVLDLDPDLPRVMGVEVHIRQVLLNLLRNALEAIVSRDSEGEKITVKTSLSGNMARVTVTDTGPGIPPDQATQIFDRGSSQKQDGLGLGLPISRSLIESDGGRLWVEPHAPGAIFHFEVPLA